MLNHIDNSLVGYTPGTPGFLALVTQELGNVGDPSDGFDAALAAVMLSAGDMDTALTDADLALDDLVNATAVFDSIDLTGLVEDFVGGVPVINAFQYSLALKTIGQLQLPPLPQLPSGGTPVQPPTVCTAVPQPSVVCTPTPPPLPGTPCPPGQSLFGSPPVCGPTIPPCPPGQTFSPTSGVCEPPPCPPGTSFVSTTGTCEPPPPPPPPPPVTPPPVAPGPCPPGSSFISTTGQCEPGPCPPGFIDVTGTGACFPTTQPPPPEPPPPAPCPPGESFISGVCQPTPLPPAPPPPTTEPCPPNYSLIGTDCIPNAPGQPCPPGYILYTDYSKTPPVSVCVPSSGPGLPPPSPGPITQPCPTGTIDTGAGCFPCEDLLGPLYDPSGSPGDPCAGTSNDPGNCVLFIGDQCVSLIP
jgi:hypothetical protein